MSNGLGAGFAALSLLAVLAGLSLLVVLTTVVSLLFHRRTDSVPTPLRYLLVAVGVGVLGVTGFAVLALYDEAPAAAWLFALVGLVPLLVAGAYLARTTERGPLDVATATVVAWGLPFLPGVVVVFGTLIGVESLFGLAPAESRRMGIAWIASAVGGLAIILGAILVGSRLEGVFRSTRSPRESE